MPRPIDIAILIALGLVAIGVINLREQTASLLEQGTNLKEKIMAEFDALNAALDEQRTEISAAVARVAADVEVLTDKISDLELDTEDQAAVDAATAKVAESIATLKGLDPVADEAPAEEPTEPVEETPAGGPVNA